MIELHVAADGAVLPGSTNDCQYGVGLVEEGTLNHQLAFRQFSVHRQSQETLGRTRMHTLIGPFTLLVFDASNTSLANVKMSPALSPLVPMSVTRSVVACSTTVITLDRRPPRVT